MIGRNRKKEGDPDMMPCALSHCIVRIKSIKVIEMERKRLPTFIKLSFLFFTNISLSYIRIEKEDSKLSNLDIRKTDMLLHS